MIHKNLFQASDEDKTLIFERHSGGMDDLHMWNLGTARIGKQNGRRIQATATPDCTDDSEDSTCNVVMALDDLQLVNCDQKHTEVNCDFEDGSLCTWQQDQQDDLDWEMMEGQDSEGNDEGHYLKLWTVDNSPLTGTLESLVLPPNQQYCFSFKYKMYGDTIGSLKVILKPHDPLVLEPEIVWQRTGTVANRWIKGQAQFNRSIPVSLLVRGEVHGQYSPIYLDTFKLKLSECSSTPSCGFENDKCSWNQRGDVKWLRGSGLTTQGLAYTPDHDHTTKSSTGKFLYASPKDSAGLRAIVEKRLWMNGTNCLNFWYVSKDNDGFVQVRERYQDGVGNNVTESVWEMPKYSLPSWQLAQVTVQEKEATTGYRVQIYASIGTKNTSMIAIDDVKFKEGACPALDYCSFEEGTCGFGNFISDEFDWIRFRSSEESEFIAPPLDMTLESTEGHSFIAPVAGRNMGDSATFITSLIPKKYQCLVFW